MSRFFLLQTTLNAVFGVLIGLGLWAIGVPNPALWGGLAFIMRYVPFIGAFLAAGLPLIVAAAVDPTWSMFFWTLALFAVSEPLLGHVIEPMVHGHNTGLSPFAIVVAATFWTTLWGPIGLVLATPLTLILVTMGRYVEHLAFLNVLLGDEPALGPAERFYQRALAVDPEEATELAEIYLEHASLTSFYDDVALASLHLAQADADRGALDAPKLAVIAEAVSTVVDDLSDLADLAPSRTDAISDQDASSSEGDVNAGGEISPDWRSDDAVLCVPGRSPLDTAAAEMLAQLLERHGIGAKIMSPKELAISRRETSEGAEHRAIVLSYLSGGRRTAHLRRVIAQLKRGSPDALIVAGLWSNAETPDDKTGTGALGADVVVRTLRQAVETCLGAATPAESANRRFPSASIGQELLVADR